MIGYVLTLLLIGCALICIGVAAHKRRIRRESRKLDNVLFRKEGREE